MREGWRGGGGIGFGGLIIKISSAVRELSAIIVENIYHLEIFSFILGSLIFDPTITAQNKMCTLSLKIEQYIANYSFKLKLETSALL